MKTRSIFTLAMISALLVGLTFAAATDQPGGPRGPRGEGMGGMGGGMRGEMGFGDGNLAQMLQGRMGEQLNLTAEQKQKLQQIADSSRDQMQQNREAVRTAIEKLNNAADKGDEAAINDAGKAVGDAMAKQAIERAKVNKEVNNVLTAEQKTQLEQSRARMREQMQQRRQERMQGERPQGGAQ
ncbi:MAG: Spy/CpxP family protein refolding chaperone [Planctomycetaceae bacterium]|nr:Spy/CpxP family protein refolding chaperone [Planctomycetaceae bacterium]